MGGSSALQLLNTFTEGKGSLAQPFLVGSFGKVMEVSGGQSRRLFPAPWDHALHAARMITSQYLDQGCGKCLLPAPCYHALCAVSGFGGILL